MCRTAASRPIDDVVLGEVEGVVVPLLHGDEGDVAPSPATTESDLAVARRAGVLEHDRGAGEPADPHEQRGRATTSRRVPVRRMRTGSSSSASAGTSST